MNDLHRDTMQEYWQALREASDIDDTLAVLQSVDKLANTDKSGIDAFDVMRLRRSVFAALREATATDAGGAVALIIDHLLWRCLRETSKKDGNDWETIQENGKTIKRPSARQAERAETHELREELSRWIEGYGQNAKEPLRDAVLNQITTTVRWMDDHAEAVQAAVWTLGAVGYRSPDVQNVLWRLLDRNDAAGDTAFSTLAAMGIPEDRRSEFIRRLVLRIPVRPVSNLGYALQQVAHPSLLDAALDLFNRSSNLSYAHGKEKSALGTSEAETTKDSGGFELVLKLTMLSHFADALWDAEQVQDAVWTQMIQACTGTEQSRGRLFLGGNLAPWCNTSHLPHDFLSLLREEIRGKTAKPDEVMPGHYNVYLACLRLQESVRPLQLRGWDAIQPGVLADVRNIALSNSRQSGYHSTSPMEAKALAWETMARAGGDWALADVQRGVEEETSGYVQGEVMEVVACFGCDPLPPAALELLREKAELNTSEGDTSRFVSVRGAENLARTTATRQAFDALLNFGFLYKGNVLRSTSDSLDQVSVWLALTDKDYVVRRLLEAATEQNEVHTRIVAISALNALAIHQHFPPEHWTSMLEIAMNKDDGLGDYFRALAVHTIGLLSDVQITGLAAPHLRELAVSAQHSELAIRARESLARHGTWRDNIDQYLAVLGMQSRDGVWRVETPADMSSKAAFTLGLLYAQSPEEFELATCDILSEGNDDAVYVLVRFLIGENEHGQRRLSKRQAAVITSNLPNDSNPFRSRIYLFEALALASPESLIQHRWDKEWSKWSPDSRVAFAQALGQANWTEIDQGGGAVTFLRLLLGDAVYAVRRASARALSLIDAGFLNEVCREWQESVLLEQRKRASEAAGWLDARNILDKLSIDPEPSVRATAERTATERRNRLWAKQYWELIEGFHEHGMSQLYKYGGALTRIGDDSDIKKLRYHASRDDIAPNFRFWLGELADDLEKKWREVTQKWPEPWLDWHGIVHEADATVRQNDKTVPVRVSLWHHPSEGHRETSAWGGALWTQQDSDTGQIELGHAHLDAVDLRPANVLITQCTSSGTAFFKGQGYFPLAANSDRPN